MNNFLLYIGMNFYMDIYNIILYIFFLNIFILNYFYFYIKNKKYIFFFFKIF